MTFNEMKLYCHQAAMTLAHLGREHGLPVPDSAYRAMQDAIANVLKPYLDKPELKVMPVSSGSPDSNVLTESGWSQSS